MKIGILTYHRTLNYGACLQAVATRVMLEKMGHNVYYIDYWPQYHANMYKTFAWSKFIALPLLGKIWYIDRALKIFRYIGIRRQNFNSFHDKYIIPFCKPLDEDFDIIIYGSDQVWRKQYETKKYNPIYFGDNNLKTKKHVSFSASMGLLPTTEQDKELVKSLVSHIDKIAVREKNLQKLLLELGFSGVSLTIDPTLLLSQSLWDEVLDLKPYEGEKYILVYTVEERNEFDMNEVRKFAKERNCAVKILCGTALKPTKERITTANPIEFVKLIRNAECIFTASFHGLAFSIIYNKEFYASFYSNSNRAKTLLDRLEISERLIAPKSKIPLLSKIDYSGVNEKYDMYKSESIDYLERATKTSK